MQEQQDEQPDEQQEEPKGTQSEPIAYSPQGAAETSSLSLRHVMKEIASGRLKSIKKGRRRIILREDLEEYLSAE
jgi:excisionase family DNA binding protein